MKREIDNTQIKQFGFYFDQGACVGCRTCQLTCKDYKDLEIGVNFRRVVEYEGGTWINDDNEKVYEPKGVFAYYTSISCNHCNSAACIKACPTGAMHKTDYGIVEVDSSKCIGCKACALACPYGAPQYDDGSNKMTKCNGCRERLDVGLKPTCVQSCPFRALDAGDIDALREQYGTSVASVAPLPSAKVTDPNLIIQTSAQSRGTEDTQGISHIPSHYNEVKNVI